MKSFSKFFFKEISNKFQHFYILSFEAYINAYVGDFLS